MVQTAQKTLRQLPYMMQVVKYEHPTELSTSPEYVINKVCTYFGITEKQIRSKSRHRNIVTARMLAMYFVYHYCPEQTLKSVGNILGCRDHTTVIHAKKMVQRFTEGPDRIWVEHYNYLIKQL